MLALLGSGPSSTAADSLSAPAAASCPATAEQVWLVSSRRASQCAPAMGSEAALDYWTLGPGQQWTPASREAFEAADDPTVPTTMFIPGNRVDANRAIEDAWRVLGPLRQQAQGRRFRLVAFSWPADKLSAPVRADVQIKAARTEAQSYYVAWLVNHVRPGVPVTLVGFSFGSRIITGALQILGGGVLAGQALHEPALGHTPLRAVLVAPALDNCWLLPGGRDERALSQVDRVLITCNGVDRALRFYPMLYGRGGPEALGATGPIGMACMGGNASKIECLNVAAEVGKVHEWPNYASSPSLTARFGWYAFLGEPSVAGSPLPQQVAGPPGSTAILPSR